MEENPSERIIDQRIRNRIMEAVHTLAEGDEGVRLVWPDEYFESFYNWIPHSQDGKMRANSAITAGELESLLATSAILDAACEATPKIMTADEFIETGWPTRVQPVAKRTLSLMLERGRFSEDHEEDEPAKSAL